MKYLILIFVIFSWASSFADFACGALKQDTANLDGVKKAILEGNCQALSALTFPVSRMEMHYQAISEDQPSWTLIKDCLPSFSTLTSGLSSCNQKDALEAIEIILSASNETLNSKCVN